MTEPNPRDEDFISTGIRLPANVLNVLRIAAAHRAEVDRTRVSVSAVVADLVRANRNRREVTADVVADSADRRVDAGFADHTGKMPG